MTDLLCDLQDLRRRLHAAPELGLHLPQTQRTVLDALAPLDLEVTTGTALTSVVAVLRGGLPGPTVLLRADMDALPVTEATGLPFAATTGTMHACGHDLHTAALVGAARILHAERATLPGDVVLAFQPGEEGCAGGRVMLEEGLLEASGQRPVAAYALHVDSVLERGVLTTRPGPVMASASGMTVVVRGTGGHPAWPHVGVDPVPAAAAVVLALQTFTARRVAPTEPAVISVTRLASTSAASNVLPTQVEVDLNIRTLSPGALELVRSELPRLVRGVGEAHGCEVDVEHVPSYPVTVNDPSETAAVLTELADLGDRLHVLTEPSMASEDFAYVLEQVPGTLLFLGARLGDGAPMHSPAAAFDDSVLAEQGELLARLARSRLRRG